MPTRSSAENEFSMKHYEPKRLLGATGILPVPDTTECLHWQEIPA